MACLWIRYDDECKTAGGRGSEDRGYMRHRDKPVTGWLASRLRGGGFRIECGVKTERGVSVHVACGVVWVGDSAIGWQCGAWSCAGHALPESYPAWYRRYPVQFVLLYQP